jgi:hypothetical protein
MSHRARGGLAVLAVLLILAGAFALLRRPRPYDTSFDTRVTEPAYAHDGPLALYDEAHLNTHTAGSWYKPFADLIRNGKDAECIDNWPSTSCTGSPGHIE